MNDRAMFFAALICLGAGWGICIPLAKIAVSTGHQPFGIVFWQLVIVALCLGALNALRGRGLPLGRRPLAFCTMIAFTGALLPDYFLYTAAPNIPAGVLGIVMSTSPIFAFPIALALGNDSFRLIRIFGLLVGFCGILLMIGPKASLPDPAMAGFVLLALLAPACYATEGNLVARFGTGGLDPVQLITGASVVGAIIALPVAVQSGQWIDPFAPWGLPEWAIFLGSAIHALVYAGYVWLVGRAGAVFTSQASYLVTGFGILWSILLLGESYSAFIWAALGLMLMGVFLVQPRPRMRLAPVPPIDVNAASQQRDSAL